VQPAPADAPEIVDGDGTRATLLNPVPTPADLIDRPTDKEYTVPACARASEHTGAEDRGVKPPTNRIWN
jgi:hypothetical protein